MKIRITFCGPLAGYAGTEKAEIELFENARFEDLLFEIGRKYGCKMPQLIWDAARGNFTHHVLAVQRFRHLTDLKEPLVNEEEINFFLIMVGG